jgi:hypothetical protein
MLLETVARGRGSHAVRRKSLFIDASLEARRLHLESAQARQLSSGISDDTLVRRLERYATEMAEAAARLEQEETGPGGEATSNVQPSAPGAMGDADGPRRSPAPRLDT